MATISVTNITDGTTADGADVNSQINTIVNAINGNLDNANIATAAAIDGSKLANTSITNSKLSTATGELGTASSYTPTYSNLTVGSGTVTARYSQIGKTVHVQFAFTYGAGSAVGTGPEVSLPVTAASGYIADQHLGSATMIDAGSNVYPAVVSYKNTTTFYFRNIAITSGTVPANTNSNSGQQPTATGPFTWASGDSIVANFTYLAA